MLLSQDLGGELNITGGTAGLLAIARLRRIALSRIELRRQKKGDVIGDITVGRSGSGKGRSSAELEAEVTALLTALDLSERSGVAASTLPAGSQKVVELALVLLGRPKVLLLDEPASGLSEPETARLAAVQADPAVRAAYLGAAE